MSATRRRGRARRAERAVAVLVALAAAARAGIVAALRPAPARRRAPPPRGAIAPPGARASRRGCACAIARAASHWPSAMQLRRSERSCGERAMASENDGTSAAISAGGTVRQKLNRPWKPKGRPIGYAASNEKRSACSSSAKRMPCSRSSSGRNVRPIVVSSASTSAIRGSSSAARSLRERSEKPPLPTRVPVVVPVPLGADVVAVEKRRIPCLGIDDVAVPLDHERVRRVDVRQQALQHELRVRLARGERGDRHDVDAGGRDDAGRQRVGQEQHAPEADALLRLCERAQRERDGSRCPRTAA